jgi:hypothetical protein
VSQQESFVRSGEFLFVGAWRVCCSGVDLVY